uniref:CCHC-type domain-containing protein n=1 Tax=Tanacetum cinerariifolium TaxID=118510 RepID=A0A6L2JRA2_TANCI|nr:hypothetical protein [Tanacetum cinerariifolium]
MPVTRQGENEAMTPESIQAMINQEIQRNSTHTHDDASQNSSVVGLSQWIKKMEFGFHISGCAVDNQVKFATCTLLGAALTWWNGHVSGNDVAAYTQRFQELALMCTKFLADETKKVDKYISGLPDNIHGNVMSTRPKAMDESIELANDLMDQKLCTYAERQTESKRKFDNNNQAQQIPKRQNVAQAYAVGTGEKKEYAGTLPLCNKCKFHHNIPCSTKYANCKKVGHLTRDCWNLTATNNQKTITCYECRNQGHYKSDCP